MQFVCKFKYDRSNSLREICTEKYPFFSIKKLCLTISLFFSSWLIWRKFIPDILHGIMNNPHKFQLIPCTIIKNIGTKRKKGALVGCRNGLLPLRGGCSAWRWKNRLFVSCKIRILKYWIHVGKRIFSYIKYFWNHSPLSETVGRLGNG